MRAAAFRNSTFRFANSCSIEFSSGEYHSRYIRLVRCPTKDSLTPATLCAGRLYNIGCRVDADLKPEVLFGVGDVYFHPQ